MGLVSGEVQPRKREHCGQKPRGPLPLTFSLPWVSQRQTPTWVKSEHRPINRDTGRWNPSVSSLLHVLRDDWERYRIFPVYNALLSILRAQVFGPNFQEKKNLSC